MKGVGAKRSYFGSCVRKNTQCMRVGRKHIRRIRVETATGNKDDSRLIDEGREKLFDVVG